MGVVPGVGRADRIVDVASFDNRAYAAADEDGRVPVDGMPTVRVELTVKIKALGADSPPAGDVAVGDAHVRASLYLDGVLEAPAQGQPFQQNESCFVETD
mgnify:CR=1 FL=1